MGPLESFLGPCRSGIFWVGILVSLAVLNEGEGQHASDYPGQSREGGKVAYR